MKDIDRLNDLIDVLRQANRDRRADIDRLRTRNRALSDELKILKESNRILAEEAEKVPKLSGEHKQALEDRRAYAEENDRLIKTIKKKDRNYQQLVGNAGKIVWERVKQKIDRR